MRAPEKAPSWPQRLTARQPVALTLLTAVVGAWWIYSGVDDAVRGERPLWTSLVSLVLAIVFIALGARMWWVRSRVRAWDAAHPGEAPAGPTPDEAARARRTRLRGWWVLSASALAAVVVAVMVDDAAGRGGLLLFAAVTVVVLVIDVLRSDRPAETIAPAPLSTET